MKELITLLSDRAIPFSKKIEALVVLHNGGDETFAASSCRATSEQKTDMNTIEMGYFGNVWVRKQYYQTKDEVFEGHKHQHDHVTLLATGAIMVHVEGYEPRTFSAPTFFTIEAEKHHQLIPLEDDTVAYCIFALRDENGELSDFYNGDNSPYGAKI